MTSTGRRHAKTDLETVLSVHDVIPGISKYNAIISQ